MSGVNEGFYGNENEENKTKPEVESDSFRKIDFEIDFTKARKGPIIGATLAGYLIRLN